MALVDEIACVEREVSERLDVLTLPLRGGHELIIERRDVWLFTYSHWSVRRGRHTFYLYRREGGVGLHLHREIVAAPPDVLVDHRNGNGLDVRRTNLRLATRSENNWNRGAPSNAKSRFRGVSFHPFSELWRCRLGSYCTYHPTEEAAARAYDAIARERHGEFAWQNFGDPSRHDDELRLWNDIVQRLRSAG